MPWQIKPLMVINEKFDGLILGKSKTIDGSQLAKGGLLAHECSDLQKCYFPLTHTKILISRDRSSTGLLCPSYCTFEQVLGFRYTEL